MAERYEVRRHGYSLVASNQRTTEMIASLKTDSTYSVQVTQVRDSVAHNRAFAYLRLAFDYWQPKKFVEKVEVDLVNDLRGFLIDNGLEQQAINALCRGFLKSLNRKRCGEFTEKSFEHFRDMVTIEAGFYYEVHTPAGTVRKAESWAFKNMTQDKFECLWHGIRQTCWDLVLHQKFATQQEADSAAEQLMKFD